MHRNYYQGVLEEMQESDRRDKLRKAVRVATDTYDQNMSRIRQMLPGTFRKEARFAAIHKNAANEAKKKFDRLTLDIPYEARLFYKTKLKSKISYLKHNYQFSTTGFYADDMASYCYAPLTFTPSMKDKHVQTANRNKDVGRQIAAKPKIEETQSNNRQRSLGTQTCYLNDPQPAEPQPTMNSMKNFVTYADGNNKHEYLKINDLERIKINKLLERKHNKETEAVLNGAKLLYLSEMKKFINNDGFLCENAHVICVNKARLFIMNSCREIDHLEECLCKAEKSFVKLYPSLEWYFQSMPLRSSYALMQDPSMTFKAQQAAVVPNAAEDMTHSKFYPGNYRLNSCNTKNAHLMNHQTAERKARGQGVRNPGNCAKIQDPIFSAQQKLSMDQQNANWENTDNLTDTDKPTRVLKRGLKVTSNRSSRVWDEKQSSSQSEKSSEDQLIDLSSSCETPTEPQDVSNGPDFGDMILGGVSAVTGFPLKGVKDSVVAGWNYATGKADGIETTKKLIGAAANALF
ncbi:unnamed protein product [Clavelina lepadiformis]|uniref:Uncharacterized protein n=1 Tax=Clavelina lepadiformis TaxID=159417 RepID=A0ABP0GQV6_CLALP